ncbi:MAG: DUF2177 family protein [Deltaproteobacteria bacterium]|nr:DUF2177 family protein [Deltaproteobacteria bacterium]
MTWYQLVKLYGLTLLVFLAVDFLWLGFLAKGFYQRHLGHLFSEQVNWAAAFLFYLLFIVGLMVFVIYPAFKAHSVWQALWTGMFFGLVAYATFDLTSLALFKGWSVRVVIVDLAWGAVLSGIVSTAGYGIARWLNG